MVHHYDVRRAEIEKRQKSDAHIVESVHNDVLLAGIGDINVTVEFSNRTLSNETHKECSVDFEYDKTSDSYAFIQQQTVYLKKK